MNKVHAELEPVSEFEMPDGIVQVEVCRKSGLLPKNTCYNDYRAGSNAVHTEYFDKDNVPTEECDHHRSGGGIIVPEQDRGKYTDDTGAYWAPAQEETAEASIGDAPEETAAEYDTGSSVIISPGVNADSNSAQGPGAGPGEN